MKRIFKNIAWLIISGLSIVSCDSSSDAVTPTITASTFEFVYEVI